MRSNGPNGQSGETRHSRRPLLSHIASPASRKNRMDRCAANGVLVRPERSRGSPPGRNGEQPLGMPGRRTQVSATAAIRIRIPAQQDEPGERDLPPESGSDAENRAPSFSSARNAPRFARSTDLCLSRRSRHLQGDQQPGQVTAGSTCSHNVHMPHIFRRIRSVSSHAGRSS